MAKTPIVGRRRWVIGFLLGAGILINYFDRVNISVAAPQLQQEFGLTPADLGLLFSAFFWSYAILQIPIGIVLDRLGVMTVSRIGAFLWGVASGIVAFATGFGFIFGARVLLGVAEAPAFPANSKATGYWFPRGERATATAWPASTGSSGRRAGRRWRRHAGTGPRFAGRGQGPAPRRPRGREARWPYAG